MKETIFFVEDDNSIHSLLKATLELNGYNVKGFKTPFEYIEELKVEVPDLLLLDLMLPGMSGYDVLDFMKQNEAYSNIPVIIVSALADEIDIVRGLDYGAVDYIGKPFGVLDLMARVRSNLRKSKAVDVKEVLKVDDIVIDKSKFLCVVNDVPVTLTIKEFELLWALIKNKNRVMTRAELLKMIWDYDDSIKTRTLDMHIKTLREKLAAVSDKQYIVTIHAVGYVIYDEKKPF